MNCQDCKHNGGIVPGSSHHIQCNIITNLGLDSGLKFLISLGLAEITVRDENDERVPAIKLNRHGVKNGWCSFPLNFDPIWIDDCKLFEDKNKITEETNE